MDKGGAFDLVSFIFGGIGAAISSVITLFLTGFKQGKKESDWNDRIESNTKEIVSLREEFNRTLAGHLKSDEVEHRHFREAIEELKRNSDKKTEKIDKIAEGQSKIEGRLVGIEAGLDQVLNYLSSSPTRKPRGRSDG